MLVDSLSLAGIEVVPVAYAIDEQGIVRYVNPSEAEIERFVSASAATAAAPEAASSPGAPDLAGLHSPREAVSAETREIQLELQVPGGAAAGGTTIPPYARNYVCEGASGRCLYRRQDVPLSIRVRPSAGLRWRIAMPQREAAGLARDPGVS